MSRYSYWFRCIRLQKYFRADLVDWALGSGVKITGNRLLLLEALTDKFTQDTKDLAAEDHEVVRLAGETIDKDAEEAQ